MTAADTPVLIVGGGPTGMAAAALLALRGVDSTIVERHLEPYPLPRAVHVDDETRRILQQIGVGAQFDTISRPMPGMRLLDADHHVFGEILRSVSAGPHGYAPDIMFDQPALEDLLRKVTTESGHVTNRNGYEVVAIEKRGGALPMLVTIRDADGIEQHLTADYVLGCDGANSVVREIIGAQLDDLRFEERWIVIDVRAEQPFDTWDGLEQVCDPHRAGTFMQVVGDHYRFEFQLLAGETIEDMQPGLAEMLRPWTKDVPYELMRVAEYTFRARVADRWRDDRIFLLGDAAHTTPPFIGQGLCAGMRDASNLSWKLASLITGQASEKILDSYSLERDPHSRHVVKIAVLIGTVMTGGQDRSARLRQAALSRLMRLSLVSRKLSENVIPPLKRGPLVLRGSRTGWHIPQPEVETREGAAMLDAALGDGFTLLSRGPLTPASLEVASAVDARIVRIHAKNMPMPGATAGITDVIDPTGTIRDWMHPAQTMLVRPDRVVMASDPTPADVPDFLLTDAYPTA